MFKAIAFYAAIVAVLVVAMIASRRSELKPAQQQSGQ